MTRKPYIFLLILLTAVGLQAQTLTSGKMRFVVTNPEAKEVQLVGLADSTLTAVVVPATVQLKQGKKKAVTYRVTSIASDAFRGKGLLESVALTPEIRVIPDSSFMDCIGLTSVTFSDSLEHIGKAAFSNCSALEQFAWPEGISEIEDHTFSG